MKYNEPFSQIGDQYMFYAKECTVDWNTLPETNIAPENRPEGNYSIPSINFQVQTAAFSECIIL